jgi:hydroxypyruvate isomerase
MERREFLRTGMAALTGVCFSDRLSAHLAGPAAQGRFQLKYAPHFGMFKHSAGDDLSDQLKFAADHGFVAWQDNGLKARSGEVQKKIGRTMASLGMEMGLFVASAAFPALHGIRKDDAAWHQVLDDIRDSVEIAKRVRSQWITIVPGRASDARGADLQSDQGIELLKRCCDILEPQGLVLVLEPLTWGTHVPGTRIVDSPACQLLFDLCRWDMTGGGLVSNIDSAWPAIGYVQCADNPGRKEPGTGTIDYPSLFRHLVARGYTGIVGMEHGNSKPGAAGERAVIEAYVAAERT